MAEEVDRISNLPDDLIHHILSYLDTKHAVETSLLSRRWKLMWTSIPLLDLCSGQFPNLPKFARFVKHVLSRRSKQTEVSSVSLKFRGAPTQFCVRSIANYAISHDVKQLTISYLPERRGQLPLCLFSSHTLKHLTLKTDAYGYCWNVWTPNFAWDLPVLETLHISEIRLDHDTDKSLDLFSKCVKLKSLTLHRFCILDLEVFNITAPQLSNVMITDGWRFPEVFNLVAPQLEYLTLSVCSTKCVIEAPRLSSFYCKGYGTFQLSTKGFTSLDNVNLNLSLSKSNEEDVPKLLDLLQKVRNAKFLTLSVDIIETLSACPNQLSGEPCPFDNLKLLKVDTDKLKNRKDPNVAMPTFVKNYLLDSSPSATFIMEIPEVPPLPPKKSRKQLREESNARKKARLEEEQKFQLQKEAYEKEKAMIEEKVRSLLPEISKSYLKSDMAELRRLVDVGKPDYSIIKKFCRLRRDLDVLLNKVLAFIPENDKVDMEAQFSSLHAQVKALFVSCLGTSQWTHIEAVMQDALSAEQSKYLDILKQLDVSDAELPPAQLSSPAKDIHASSSIASSSGSKADIEPVQNS